MALSPEISRSAITQMAEAHASEILARRRVAREIRSAALAAHPSPISVETKVFRLGLPEAGVEPATTVGNAQTSGYLLAIGDSWFDYPICDVLTYLDTNYGYDIESSAHKGDSIEFAVSHVGQLDRFARLIDKLDSLSASPKAVLVSLGGNDIAGAEFGMLLNDFDLPGKGWNEQIVAGVVDTRIANAYRLLVAKINAITQGSQLRRNLPILIHGYDYPVPDGRGFLGGWGALPGPWLKPGFDEKLFTDVRSNSRLMVNIIDRFNDVLQSLSREPGFENVHYIDLRGMLGNDVLSYKEWWANELHPTGGNPLDLKKNGFSSIADKFQTVLKQLT